MKHLLSSFDFKIMLQCSYRCNHGCWFCNEWDNKTNLWSRDQCDLVIDKLRHVPTYKNKIYVLFYGGEPTLNEHWEYMHHRLVEIFTERELLIQTQTNLSIDSVRLNNFLTDINKEKQPHHVIDISSSYHIGKQPVEEFIEKMDILQPHVGFGSCMFGSELICKEQQTLHEFETLNNRYPGKVCYRHTVVNDPSVVFNKKGFERYKAVAAELGLNMSESQDIEYKYLKQNFPELVPRYHPFGYDIIPNTNIMAPTSCWYNFNRVAILKQILGITGGHKKFVSSRYDSVELAIDDLYDDAVTFYNKQGVHCGRKNKYTTCDCGVKGMVVSHDLKVYNCLDNCYKDIRGTTINSVDMTTWFNKNIICLSDMCVSTDSHIMKENKAAKNNLSVPNIASKRGHNED